MQSEEFYAQVRDALEKEGTDFILSFSAKAHNQFLKTSMHDWEEKSHWHTMRELSTDILENRELERVAKEQ